jgi:hypothetical protein
MNLNASHGIKAKEPNWAPLEQRIGHHCADFMWMYARDGVEFYKHIGTRRYLCLDSHGGVFLNIQGVLQPIEFDCAYAIVTGCPRAQP